MEDKIYAVVREFYGETIRDITKNRQHAEALAKEIKENNTCYDYVYVTEMQFDEDGDLVEI